MGKVPLILLASYLLGAIPSAYLFTRLATGQDIRYVGNGNMGMRNALAVAGRWPATLTLGLDLAKGAASYWLARRYLASSPWFYVSGVCLLLGHWFPIWLSWRGGIGQAAITGFAMALCPVAAPIGVAVFLVAKGISHRFNLAFGIAAVAFLAMAAWQGVRWDRLLMIVLLLLAVGVKKWIDMPRQRALLLQQGRPPKESAS